MMPRPPFRLRSYLVFFGLVLVLPSLVFCVTATVSAGRMQGRSMRMVLRHVVRQAAEGASARLFDIAEQTQHLAEEHAPAMAAAAAGNTNGWTADVLQRHPLFLGVEWFGPDGRSLAAVGEPIDADAMGEELLNTLRHRAGEGKPVMGPAFQGAAADGWRLASAAALPPAEGGRGTVVAVVDPSLSLAGLDMPSHPPWGIAMIDRQGRIIAAAGDGAAEVARRLAERRAGGRDAWKTGGWAFVSEPVPEAGWTCGLGFQQAGTPVDSRTLLGGILAGSGCFVLLLLSVARRTDRHVIAPITALSQTARRIQSGEWGARVTPAGPAEVRAMAAAFNALVTDVEASREAVLRLNSQLEERFAARTAELNQSLARLERFRRLADSSETTGMAIVSSGGIVDYANPALARMLDLPWPLPARSCLRDLIGQARPSTTRFNTHADRGGRRHQRSIRLQTRSGRWVELAVCIFRLPAEPGPAPASERHFAHGLTVTDFSGRIAFERELEQAKNAAEAASRGKSSFLANLSHEIRTPMNAILGFAQFLRDDSLGPQQSRAVDAILKGGEHLLALLNSVLDMARVEAGRVRVLTRPFDLREVLRTVETMIRGPAEAKSLQLLVELSDNLPYYIDADEVKLRQILINLLDNAVKFTASGSVTLRVSCEGTDVAPLLVCEVIDTGPGIAAEEMATLFTPFGQTAAGTSLRAGTGLGLALSMQFARLMGGDISVRSSVDDGTAFRLTLPVKLMETVALASSGGAAITSLLPSDRRPRILNVDDEPLNRAMVSLLLRKVGFDVRDASDGESCLRLAANWQPDLVLLDLAMPGMDGIGVLHRMRGDARLGRIPVVMLTAHAFGDERVQALAAGANEFVRKPFRIDDLLHVIARLVRVDYAYETAPAGAGQAQARRETFADLPPAILERLRQAAACADLDALDAICEEVGRIAPAKAAVLRGLVGEFDYEGILRRLPDEPGPPRAGA